jgi:hypothetical protein
VDDFIAMSPGNGSVYGGLRYAVATVIHQRLPIHIASGRDAFDFLTQR